MPIEIVFDMLGFNMLNPKMKNHPPFVLPRLSYSSTTLYYTILLQYYSVLQSTIPVLLCTTKYYSSTSLYYKVLLQYYSVLQSTTPVLLQYYSVLLMIDPRSSRDVSTTSPNTAPATKSNTHHWSSSHMKRYFP